MNTLEDRLRDAYRGVAATVRPETIRSLGDQALGTPIPASRRRRVLIPLAAAVAVAAVAITAAVAVPLALPGQPRGHRPAAVAQAGAYPKFFVALTGNGYSLAVRNATTGALVARVSPPHPGLNFAAVATGNSRTFVTAVWKAGICATHFYQFRLSSSGAPTALTPFAIPELRQLVSEIAVSGNGQTFAYYTELCTSDAQAASYLAATNLATGRIRRWSVPGQADVGPLSLTANGRLLGYNIELTKLFASVARVMPTDAAPGSAAQRSRTVVRASRFGPSTDISSAAITTDGSALYFTTNSTGTALAKRLVWQLRMADLATGRIRIVQAFAGGIANGVSADPSGRYLLLQSDQGPAFSRPRLARLDTATWQIAYLRAAWMGANQSAGIAW